MPWVMVSGYNTAGMVYADLGGSSVRSAARPAREREPVT